MIDDFPKTMTRFSSSAIIQRPKLFDPALKHYAGAYRQGEPNFFGSTELAVKWYMARQRANGAALRAMNALSTISNQLVLRGSLTLWSWFPNVARLPGDIDFLVVPEQLSVESPQGYELVQEIWNCLKNLSKAENIDFYADELAMDDIWTYDRAPGKRFLLPWISGYLPLGAVQIDLVFRETIPGEAIRKEKMTLDDGEPIEMQVSNPEISLVWKLLWLLTDCYPQGKDLYDAVLLAESTKLNSAWLREALKRSSPHQADKDFIEMLDGIDADWDNFVKEYPYIQGAMHEWRSRLIAALHATM